MTVSFRLRPTGSPALDPDFRRGDGIRRIPPILPISPISPIPFQRLPLPHQVLDRARERRALLRQGPQLIGARLMIQGRVRERRIYFRHALLDGLDLRSEGI
ncbi:MAG TPA: hypothetical protein VFI41_07665, partial [Gemmatimonadales bacterium]|nr:hypothetical protein [Gemmatimonadales bacterium]